MLFYYLSDTTADSMKKKIWIFLLGFVLAGGLGAAYIWFYVYNKKHKDIENARADHTTTATDLITEFEQNDTSANRKYDEKVVQLSGTVASVIPGDSLSSVVFDEQKNLTVTVEFLPAHNEVAKNLKPGNGVTVKALYVGYVFDPLLAEFGEKGDIKLKKGSLVEEPR